MNEIYFDNSSTTRVCEEAAAAALRAMREEYGNPSSVHHLGAVAFHALNDARSAFADILHVAADEIIFTSCGTESNNTALLGAAALRAKNPGRILISAVEHPSVSEPAKLLQSQGWDLQYIPVNQQGVVDMQALEQLLTPETSIVAVMQVNNETGAIQPLTEIGTLIRRKAPAAFYHVDGIQAFARIPAEPLLWQADSYAASGHKIHAPKGVGLLWLNRSRNLPPYLRGGGQERGMRSGTENMAGICAFSAAARIASENMEKNDANMRLVKQALIDRLQAALPDVYINGEAPDCAAPHIVNLSFVGCRSEVLLHYLEERGIYVSAGSACNSRSSKGSKTLINMGISPERVDSALRFSLCRFNTVEEAKQAAELIIPSVQEVRMIMGRNKKRR